MKRYYDHEWPDTIQKSVPNILELMKKNSKGELLTLSEKALIKKHQEQQRQKSQSKKRKYRR